MTLLLAAAGLLLLLGSSLVIHTLIKADVEEPQADTLPLAPPSATREQRRAA